MEELFDSYLQTRKVKLSTASEAVYRSMWSRICEKSAACPKPLSASSLSAVLAHFDAYATKKKALALYKQIAESSDVAFATLGAAYREVSMSFIERATHRYHLNTHLGVLEGMHQYARSVNGWKGARLSAAIQVLWDAGLRQEEFLSMTWLNIRLETGVLRVPGKPSREMPLSGTGVKLLNAWKQASPAPCASLVWVADSKGAVLPASTLWRQLKRAEPEGTPLELSLCGPTAFRAAFAKRCAQQGMPVEAIQRLLGHAQLVSTYELLRQMEPAG